MYKHLLTKATCALLLFAFIITSLPASPTFARDRNELPSTIRIGLTRSFANRDSIHIANNLIHVGHEYGGEFSYSGTVQSYGGFTARVSGGVVVLYSGGHRVFAFGAGTQVRCAHGGTIQLGNYSYRGAIEFRPSGGQITAINVICPEEYLYGVLPMEMSTYFHINALRAQAIASRTFMVFRMNEGGHRNHGFYLCDGVHCQTYRGTGREHYATTQAVNDTRGQMIFYNNEVILASYFSSSGGATDNSENVWHATLPYLRAVTSIAEHNPSTWERTFTMAQLSSATYAAGGRIGTATGMSVSRVSPLGRAQEITIYGTSGQFRVSGETIRNFFAPVGGALMSRNFHIAGASGGGTMAVSVTDGHTVVSGDVSTFSRVRAAQGQPIYVFDGRTMRRVEQTPAQAVFGNSVTLVGSGWGHGVGMSQRGAVGMALLGYDYREILMHYYTGVEIR